MIANVNRALRSDFARHGLLVFISNFSVNVLGYIFHAAISRKIGVEQYGVLAALNAAYMLGTAFANVAGTIVIKYAAEFRATGDRSHLAALVRMLSLYGSLACVAFVIAGILAAPAVGGYLNVANTTAVAFCIAIIGISSLGATLRSVFSGIEDFSQFAVAAVVESIGKALLGISFVYAGYGVLGAFVGWTIGSTISLAYSMGVLLWRYRGVAREALYIDVRRLVTTMAGVSSATVLLTSIAYVDVIVVKHFADPTTAGLYGALSLSGKIILFFVGFVPMVLLPKASRLALSGQSPMRILLAAMGVVVAFSLVGLAGFYLFPRFVITALAGASFASGAPYVFSYGIAMVILAALNTVVFYKIGIHRFDFVIPLAACAAGEFLGISFYHASLGQIVDVLIIGNTAALAFSTFRINAPIRPAASAAQPEAA